MAPNPSLIDGKLVTVNVVNPEAGDWDFQSHPLLVGYIDSAAHLNAFKSALTFSPSRAQHEWLARQGSNLRPPP